MKINRVHNHPVWEATSGLKEKGKVIVDSVFADSFKESEVLDSTHIIVNENEYIDKIIITNLDTINHVRSYFGIGEQGSLRWMKEYGLVEDMNDVFVVMNKARREHPDKNFLFLGMTGIEWINKYR